MTTEDQTATIDFLASPSAHGGARVERIDTHASVVFLAGDRAYKLKRAVLFDYLDFSTAERRRARIRVSAKAIHEAREAEEVREYGAREDAAPAGGFGSLADKLRGALTPRQK
ncbi:MAG TPA: hypothetical protein VMO26_04065 [Vicinamibacterales bacterium]|nr:hypothetical protein [Vicinamibacterales bacterium]